MIQVLCRLCRFDTLNLMQLGLKKEVVCLTHNLFFRLYHDISTKDAFKFSLSPIAWEKFNLSHKYLRILNMP